APGPGRSSLVSGGAPLRARRQRGEAPRSSREPQGASSGGPRRPVAPSRGVVAPAVFQAMRYTPLRGSHTAPGTTLRTLHAPKLPVRVPVVVPAVPVFHSVPAAPESCRALRTG